MHRFLLSPRWLALHAATAAVVVAFGILGWWQLGVYQESRERQQTRDVAPAPVAELIAPGEALGEAQDRKAIAVGRYLAGDQLLIPGRVRDGVLGAYVVTPLRAEDGMVTPVLRGWVDDLDAPAGALRPPGGRVQVSGFLLPPETPGHATVREGRPLEDGQAAYIAPAELAERSGLDEAAMPGGYLLLTEQAPAQAGGPLPLDVGAIAPIRDVSPWQNLSYWAQWWVFAVAAVAFWASAVRSAVRSRREQVSESARPHVLS